MDDAWKRELWTVLSAARTPQETRELLEALLTHTEMEELSRRWQIVKHLIQGKTQRQVREAVGVSIATVERGAREVKHGGRILKTVYQRLHRKHPTED